MAFLSHLRPNSKSNKPITKRKTPMGIKVTKATPRVAMITASVATAANAPTIELRQLVVIPATRTSVNASTNSTDAARNAAITIAHCISFFLLHTTPGSSELVRQFPGSDELAHKCKALVFCRGSRHLEFGSISTQLTQPLYFVLYEASPA